MNKKRIIKILKEIYPYIIVVVVVVLLRTFIITPAIVDGASMEPNLHDNNVHKRLFRTFYRVLKEGNVLSVIPPDEVISSNFNFSINYNGKFNNDFCNQLFKPNNKIK